MSRFITPPDKDFQQVPNILIKNFKPSEVELVALTAKVSSAEFDIYLYSDDFADADWAIRAVDCFPKALVPIKNQSLCSPISNLQSNSNEYDFPPVLVLHY